MTRIAITGCSSRFVRVLLPLLQQDPEVEQIIGIDLAPPAATLATGSHAIPRSRRALPR